MGKELVLRGVIWLLDRLWGIRGRERGDERLGYLIKGIGRLCLSGGLGRENGVDNGEEVFEVVWWSVLVCRGDDSGGLRTC